MVTAAGCSLKSLTRRNVRTGRVPGTLVPADLVRRYGLEPLYRQGIYGQGERIGFLELTDPSPADDAAFWQRYSLDPGRNRPVRSVEVGRSAGAPGALGESDLDVQVAGALAPGAQLVAYALDGGASLGSFLGQVYDALAQAGRDQVRIVSCSLGVAENLFSAAGAVTSRVTGERWADPLGFSGALDDLIRSRGLAVFASAGDSGVYGGEPFGDFAPQPIWPAIQPAVVACGGTQLLVPGEVASGEAAWGGQTLDSSLPGYSPANTLPQASGGGGVSSLIAAPAYQSGLGYGARATPDLAAFAGPLVIVHRGQELSVWGTSAAAPITAAIAALFHQATGRFLEHAFFYPRLKDVAQGNNWNSELMLMGLDTFDCAGPGFDLCTGAGTPELSGLIGP